MKLAGRIISVFLVLLFTLSAFGYFFWYQPKFKAPAGAHLFSIEENNAAISFRLRQKALLAKDYTGAHEYDNKICFLLDMRIPSGKNRFFVYNLKKDSVEKAGMVTHGSGSDNETDHLKFSNTPNSYCTSLGKYKIGKSYYGRFGLAYKLYGLDNSNSKAFDRFIVLHGHDCVPNDEIAPLPLCVSQGCPTVSPSFLTELKKYSDRSDKPILLWIYY